MRILIVDDTTLIRDLASALIEESGHESMKAASGQEAISHIENNRPDFIFMDVEMPGMDGFDTTVEIRDLLGDDWIPIIFLTGLTSDDQYIKGIDSGGDDYLTKPINPPIFKAKIKAMERIVAMKNNLDELNKTLAKVSITDGLTELTNRRGFSSHADKVWRQCQRDNSPISIIMMDIDHFKLFNDNYGHQAGDSCLKQVAQAIAAEAKRPLDLIARYGGEEFIAILPNTNLSAAQNIAESIRVSVESLRIPHFNSSTSDSVTLSLGVSSCADVQHHSLHNLTKSADSALYLSKEQGRNRTTGHPLKPRQRVMVIEDDEATRSLFEIILEEHCEVIQIENIDMYASEVTEKQPDLILLDIKMPNISGFDVCKNLKQRVDTRNIPIILVSCLDKSKAMKQGKEVGANGYLMKPFEHNTLLAKVTNFLN